MAIFEFTVCIRSVGLQTSKNSWNMPSVYFVTFGGHMF